MSAIGVRLSGTVPCAIYSAIFQEDSPSIMTLSLFSCSDISSRFYVHKCLAFITYNSLTSLLYLTYSAI